MWFKEYHPKDWATLQKYVASGRWRLAGIVDSTPSIPHAVAESLMRQALYGKRFFRQEFGKVSNDIYLPDCSASASRCRRSPRTRALGVLDAEAHVGTADSVRRRALERRRRQRSGGGARSQELHLAHPG